MKKIFCYVFLLVYTPLFAQKETNHWVLGEYVGLDFNFEEPVVFSSSLNTNYCTVSIFDGAT